MKEATQELLKYCAFLFLHGSIFIIRIFDANPDLIGYAYDGGLGFTEQLSWNITGQKAVVELLTILDVKNIALLLIYKTLCIRYSVVRHKIISQMSYCKKCLLYSLRDSTGPQTTL